MMGHGTVSAEGKTIKNEQHTPAASARLLELDQVVVGAVSGEEGAGVLKVLEPLRRPPTPCCTP